MQYPTGRALAAVATTILAACASGGATTWRAADYNPLPLGGLAGVPVLIYPIATIQIDSTVDGIAGETPETRALVDSVIHAALTRRAPRVPWVSAAVMRRVAAEHDSLPDLETLELQRISARALTTVPQPLLNQMRALAGISSSRYSLVPAQMHLRLQPPGRYRVEFKLVIADTQVGGIGWASDVDGEGASPWDAITEAMVSLTSAPQR